MTPPPLSERLDDTDDRELVERSRAGDQAALEVLLRRHHPYIHQLCHRICRERGDAEDSTQNALLAIVRGLPGFDGSSSFRTWSHRVATNACLDELRRRGRRPTLTDGRGDGAADPSDGAPGSGERWTSVSRSADRLDPGVDPADAVVRDELRARLQRALDDLPDDFRLPVVLRDVGELDYAEIAEVLDIAPGTVRSRISRGRRRLAEALGSEFGNPAVTGDVREVEP